MKIDCSYLRHPRFEIIGKTFDGAFQLQGVSRAWQFSVSFVIEELPKLIDIVRVFNTIKIGSLCKGKLETKLFISLG